MEVSKLILACTCGLPPVAGFVATTMAFARAYGSLSVTNPDRVMYGLMEAHFGFHLLSGIIFGAWMFGANVWVTRELRKQAGGFCMKCGYNLTGNESGICSECGTPIKMVPTAGTNRQAEP
jgi:hypothetical protein